MTETSSGLQVYCPTCDRPRSYLGKLIEGATVFHCRKCKKEYRAELVKICRLEVEITPIEKPIDSSAIIVR